VQETKPKDLPFYSSRRKVPGKEVCTLKQKKHLFSHLVHVEDKRRENSRCLVEGLSGDCVDCMR
jgi:hypothetical protein